MIKRRGRLLVYVFLPFMLSACVSGTPFELAPKFDSDKAQIYIYREAKGLGALVQHYLYIEDKRQVKIANGGYSVLEVTPGEQTIYYTGKASVGTYLVVALEAAITGGKPFELFSFEPKAGETYYLKFRLNTKNEDRTQAHSMVLVESSIARVEIAKTKKIELVKNE